jgi:histidinol-phosphatase (PHP family)
MDMAERACALGIKHFTLTDHVEIEKYGKDKWDYAAAVNKSYDVYREIKERFKGKMNVYYGAELGQPLYNPALADKLLAEHDYDFVLGSQHRTKTYPYLNKVPDTDEDRKRCLDEYFEEELALAKWGKFCSLSHLTFPLRFLTVDISRKEPVINTDKPFRTVDMTVYDGIIDEILRTIISKDIALEVNSSGIRKGLGVPMPCEEYVARYREMGGRMITLGSDAHRVSDVAADMPECIEMLKKLGFSEICIFDKKQPNFIKI